MRLLGLDPGLRLTGWGVIDVDGNHLGHVADGVVRVPTDGSLAERLALLYAGLVRVIAEFAPEEAAVEETFANRNPDWGVEDDPLDDRAIMELTGHALSNAGISSVHLGYSGKLKPKALYEQISKLDYGLEMEK